MLFWIFGHRLAKKDREKIFQLRLRWLTALVALLCLYSTAAWSATFILSNGDILEGDIIHATRNTLMVREKIGSIHQLALSEVQAVKLTTSTGGIVSGALLGWREGEYEIESDDGKIRLRDGRVSAITTDSPSETERNSPPETEADLPAKTEADSPGVPLLIISSAEAAEGMGEVMFQISLSSPTNKSIYVVYGTFNRTAKAGEDYQKEQGSIEIAPGDSGAVLRIPLIDDDLKESDETFHVFVSVDKNVAIIENNRGVGTILNDDE